MILEIIDEAVADGAGHGKACRAVGLAPTTITRWRASPDADDERRGPKTKPRNALSEQERAKVVAIMNMPEHSSMSPDALVPYLATLGMYFASQSTLYRIARAMKLLSARGRARRRSHRRPREHVARGPNQVWSWDITFLPTTIRGRFLKLYVVIDVWSRMIVGAEVHEHEDDAIAAKLVERCCAEQGVVADQLALHAKAFGTDLERFAKDFGRAAVSDSEVTPTLRPCCGTGGSGHGRDALGGRGHLLRLPWT